MKYFIMMTIFSVFMMSCSDKHKCEKPVYSKLHCYSDGKEYLKEDVRHIKFKDGIWTYMTFECFPNGPCVDQIKSVSGTCVLIEEYSPFNVITQKECENE